jgi:hypothetical protein
MRTIKRAGIAAVIASSAVLAGAILPAQAATPGWRQVFSHHYGTKASGSLLGPVVALGANDAWAFGGTSASNVNESDASPIAAHWNGRAWSAATLPAGVSTAIAAVSAPAANDIWAVTGEGGQILHYDGHAWRVAKHVPGTFAEFTGITALSASNVWVFGGGGFEGGLGTWHFNGRTWTESKTGNAVGLERGSAISASDVWAIGGTQAPWSTVERYNGHAWETVAKGLSGQLTFRDIWAIADNNVWASASVYKNGTNTGILLHYNGKAWTKFSPPWPVSAGNISDIDDFASDGSNGLWMAYTTEINPLGRSPQDVRYVAHRTGRGAWTRIEVGKNQAGAVLQGIALIPGTKSLWADGAAELKTGSNAAIWAYGSV